MSLNQEIEDLKKDIDTLKNEFTKMKDTLEYVRIEVDSLLMGYDIDEKLDPVKRELEELFFAVFN